MFKNILKLGLLSVVTLLLLTEGLAVAQIGGMGGMGGMGGQNMKRPKRKLHKNKAPALSPALNLVEGVPTSFEGQFLMRTLPQEQALKQFGLTEKSIDKLQNEITDTDNQVKSGVIGGTGHKVRFFNYGGYYSYPKGGGVSR
jgi:hypothetical protein